MSDSLLMRGYVFAGMIIVIWTGFILVTRLGGTGTLTPFDIGAIRFGTAVILVLPLWLRAKRPSLLTPKVIALTLTGGLGYTLLTYSAFRLAPAAHGGILLSGFQPFAMPICAWAIMGERPSPLRWAGMAVIALGAATLAYEVFQADQSTLGGDLMFVAASVCWALYTVLARRWRIAPWEVTVNVAMLAAIVYLPIYLLALPKRILEAGAGEILLQVAYQGVLAAVIQMVIYMRAVELLGTSRMGMLVALVPPLGALAAVPVLGEPLTPMLIVSLALVSAGVLVGNANPSLLQRFR
ncbi:EamA/RhaT family transporter [Paramagnetospirillum kuznetsovii]|uniref:EamA/RhaT family transporter n=1 Tax=Paramagnetospirillum kuznetsovii TaxID=2053833 RepID=A0A364P0J7_9PROT|nr:DMT family transporter [Paramagnetospirillum kuznetsovii]RAU22826.1 EamA/RhaT family transporter [Paramagnetospirillum kuznetsovii]